MLSKWPTQIEIGKSTRITCKIALPAESVYRLTNWTARPVAWTPWPTGDLREIYERQAGAIEQGV
jgi:hypothetical protein